MERFDMVLLFLSAEEKNGKDVKGFLLLLWPISFFIYLLFFLFSLHNRRYWGHYWCYWGTLEGREQETEHVVFFTLTCLARCIRNTSLMFVVQATFCCNSSSKHSLSSLLVRWSHLALQGWTDHITWGRLVECFELVSRNVATKPSWCFHHSLG